MRNENRKKVTEERKHDEAEKVTQQIQDSYKSGVEENDTDK